MQNKIIFLDVDGVLNSMPYMEHNPDQELNPENIQHLANIQHATNAKIVLCSTWKACDCPDEPNAYKMYRYLIDALKKYNLTVYDKTPDTNKGRPHEIHSWLKSHPETSTFVILDDDYSPENYAVFNMDSHLVQTKFFCHNQSEGGLQDCHASQAIRILNQGQIDE